MVGPSTRCVIRRTDIARSFALMLLTVGASQTAAIVEGADFHCRGGDVQCVIDAMNAANISGDATTIRLDASTFALTASDNLSPPVSLSSPAENTGNGLPVVLGQITITGVAADASVIERADFQNLPNQNLFRIFNVAASGTLVLNRVTIRGGNPGRTATAGGIYSEGTLILRHTVVSNNVAGNYPALQVASGSVTMLDTLVANNSHLSVGGDLVGIGFRRPALPSSASAFLVAESRCPAGHSGWQHAASGVQKSDLEEQ